MIVLTSLPPADCSMLLSMQPGKHGRRSYEAVLVVHDSCRPADLKLNVSPSWLSPSWFVDQMTGGRSKVSLVKFRYACCEKTRMIGMPDSDKIDDRSTQCTSMTQ